MNILMSNRSSNDYALVNIQQPFYLTLSLLLVYVFSLCFQSCKKIEQHPDLFSDFGNQYEWKVYKFDTHLEFHTLMDKLGDELPKLPQKSDYPNLQAIDPINHNIILLSRDEKIQHILIVHNKYISKKYMQINAQTHKYTFRNIIKYKEDYGIVDFVYSNDISTKNNHLTQEFIDSVKYIVYQSPGNTKVEDGDTLTVRYRQFLIKDTIRIGKSPICVRYQSKSGWFKYCYKYTENGIEKYCDYRCKEPAFLEYPVDAKKYRVNSSFGKRKHPIKKIIKHHNGTDYKGKIDDPAYCIADGIISKIVVNDAKAGNYIEINHGTIGTHTYKSRYLHLNKFAGKSKGSRVYKKETIGYIGKTGEATGPHLHLELHKNNVPVNFEKVKKEIYITTDTTSAFNDFREIHFDAISDYMRKKNRYFGK